jgi:hypothetical protein
MNEWKEDPFGIMQKEVQELSWRFFQVGLARQAAEHCKAVIAEAKTCGCEATAPLLPNGEYDVGNAFVLHGVRCRAGRMNTTERD